MTADEEEIGRLGEKLLSQPGAADEIGDAFNRIVRLDPVKHQRWIAILERLGRRSDPVPRSSATDAGKATSPVSRAPGCQKRDAASIARAATA